MYSSISDELVHETVQVALDKGFEQFDTAPHYGCGLGEEKLGRALKNILHDDDKIKVFSKVGRWMLKINEDDLLSSKSLHSIDRIEIDFDNTPGSEKCIFPDAPLDVLPG
jgi:aryl-alcohol dehydrogenase-like predicted oxidoreductase